jgi:hypothetical protein
VKKLPIVKRREGDFKDVAKYGYSDFNMAWVSNPGLGRQQATAVLRCREFLCACVRAQIYGNDHGGNFITNKDAPIDVDRTRLLILNDGSEDLSKQQFKENLFHGKVLLNVYEKVGNFSSLSKISTINHERYGKQWLITGPKEWMKAGQLISAMTFLLRLATFGNLIDTSNLTTVETSFRRIVNSKIKPIRYTTDVDQNLECFWDKMWVLIKFQNELFSNDYKKNYNSELNNDGFGMRCGIRNLAAESSGLPGKIDEKFMKLCKEHLPRKGDI